MLQFQEMLLNQNLKGWRAGPRKEQSPVVSPGLGLESEGTMAQARRQRHAEKHAEKDGVGCQETGAVERLCNQQGAPTGLLLLRKEEEGMVLQGTASAASLLRCQSPGLDHTTISGDSLEEGESTNGETGVRWEPLEMGNREQYGPHSHQTLLFSASFLSLSKF